MKILIVCQHYFPERFRITDIAESLANKYDHDVTVLTALPNYPEGEIYSGYEEKKNTLEKINNVSVYRTNIIPRGHSVFSRILNYVSFPIFSRKVLRKLYKLNFDIIFINQLSPILMALPGLWYKRKKGTKCILYAMDLWPESLKAGGINQNNIIFLIMLKISRYIYKRCDKIFVTSPGFVDYFKSVLKLNNKISFLPQYSENIFNKSDQPIQLPEGDKYFVFAGNIGKLQSVETILFAAKELKDHNDIKFLIAGSGSNLENCLKICEENNLSNVVFLGELHLSEMPRLYEQATAMLITLNKDKNLSKTIPGKFQSYLAYGKPVIGAINGEVNRIINENNLGIAVEAENFIELSRAILEILGNKNYSEFGINSYDYYVNNYSKEKFMKTLIDEMEITTNV